ncbi:uncharacterized protein CCR75_003079 [Bremia lactucae]|uniref:Uncharacterized protein n=1 Tax=Bremia lactucae TaxID=4779 RepID=A0A976NZ07_BRELC|nr:hypothetical protein CCR75_003079 [Bremia lactucae]
MESLYARDTPTAQERKLKLAGRDCVIEDGQVTLKPQDPSHEGQNTSVHFDNAMDTSNHIIADADAKNTSNTTEYSAEETFEFNFSSLPREDLEDQWRQHRENLENSRELKKKTEERRLAELSEESILSVTKSKDSDNSLSVSHETASAVSTILSNVAQHTRQSKVALNHRKQKPAITINTSTDLSNIGAKRPPPTPVSPPTFSWDDILRVQNLIERCLQQYWSKNDILVTLKEQADVDPAFTNVVWQKLVEQNPTFFCAYRVQLQLKEQIIAFNYLVGQQKAIKAKGGNRFPYHSNNNRASASLVPTPYSLATTAATPALPSITMDARSLLRTPIRSTKRTKRLSIYQLGNPSLGLNGISTGMIALPPPSPLPLPSPIKNDLDTHAFFS